MRFESIQTHNYRQYKDLYLEFPKETANDIHLIVATNGVGKTTFLNAINWCLYGDEPHKSGGDTNNDQDSFPICNLDAMDEAVRLGEDFVEVSVSIRANDGKNIYTFIRTAKVKALTRIVVGRTRFEVEELVNGSELVIHPESEAVDIVSRFLPKKIREYFYFDAEQLLSYFNTDTRSLSHIKESIYEIAQVNVVDRVEDHLRDFVNDYNKQIRKLSPNVDKILALLEEARKRVDLTKKEIEALSSQITEAENAIYDANRIIDGNEHAVEDNNRYNANLVEIERLRGQIDRVNVKLAKFIRMYLLLVLCYETNRKTQDYIVQQDSSDKSTLDTSLEVIEESLVKHQCKVCGSKLNEEAEDYLRTLVDKFATSATARTLTEIKNDIYRGIQIGDYEKQKQEIFDELEGLEERLRALIAENDALHAKVISVNVDYVTAAMERKVANERSMKINIEKRGSAKNQLVKEEEKLKEAKAQYEQALNDDDACAELREYLQFVSRAQDIVAEIKREIVDDVKRNMERITIQIFEDLIWKKDFYDRIELDDDFKVRLFDKKHNISCLNSTSAAERQLLAFAFTIALHKVSGYDHLLCIDTPVGRISDVNRLNFANALIDVSTEKQIIITFTISEYSQEVREIFRRDIVSSYNELTLDTIISSIGGVKNG